MASPADDRCLRPAAAGVAASPGLGPEGTAPPNLLPRPPPAPPRGTPFPGEGTAAARPRARPRPATTWRQEASIPAEERERRSVRGGSEAAGGCGGTARSGGWGQTDPATRSPGLGRSRPCVSRGRAPAQPGLERRARREERARERNEPRSQKDLPTRDRRRGHGKPSSASGEVPGTEKRGLTLRPRPGSNCWGGPRRKLRLLTDGAHRRRLQLPEASARGPQSAWQRQRFLIRKRRGNS